MAVVLVTGKPGAAKTLWVVSQIVDKLRMEKDSAGKPRGIYTDINGLDLPDDNVHWLDDAREWYELPKNSIAIMDEVQTSFPVRNGSKPMPRGVKEMNTHRHGGYDIYLITQHPNLIDRGLHALVDQHVHFHRVFGLGRSKMFRWEGINENPAPLQNRANAQKKIFRHKAKYFGYYKSSSEHNVKVRPPWKIMAALGFMLFILLGSAFFFWGFTERYRDPEAYQAGIMEATAADTVLKSACASIVGRSQRGFVMRYSSRVVVIPASFSISSYTVFNESGEKVFDLCGKDLSPEVVDRQNGEKNAVL